MHFFKNKKAFSLVEMLVTITIIGTVSFIALPRVTAIQKDAETNLAISRAEALNMAIASYKQIRGATTATTAWDTAGNSASRYLLLKNYLGYAEPTLAEYEPDGYSIVLPPAINTLTKVTLKDGSTQIRY
jgi:prepilin-type N-terminal cleavage/methylation domain-containing protein